jgi:hypothetical protein
VGGRRRSRRPGTHAFLATSLRDVGAKIRAKMATTPRQRYGVWSDESTSSHGFGEYSHSRVWRAAPDGQSSNEKIATEATERFVQWPNTNICPWFFLYVLYVLCGFERLDVSPCGVRPAPYFCTMRAPPGPGIGADLARRWMVTRQSWGTTVWKRISGGRFVVARCAAAQRAVNIRRSRGSTA